MDDDHVSPSLGEVPDQVFNQFLKDLEKAELPTELVERFRKTLIQDRVINEKGLRAALFGEDTEP